jgi:hypothetical protein
VSRGSVSIFGIDAKYFSRYDWGMEDKRERGRPQGKQYVATKSLKLREADVRRLARLAEKMDRDQSWVIREAVRLLAVREGVE